MSVVFAEARLFVRVFAEAFAFTHSKANIYFNVSTCFQNENQTIDVEIPHRDIAALKLRIGEVQRELQVLIHLN